MYHVTHVSISIDVIEETTARGDGYKTEFFKTIPSALAFAKSICAFANTKGGTLFVGINNSGEVKHTRNKYGDLDRIEKAARLVTPTPLLSVEAVDFKNRELILVRVQESMCKPCSIKEQDHRAVYMRSDTGNTPATRRELKRIVSRD
jgi:predicted HTH transcriptional regulator